MHFLFVIALRITSYAQQNEYKCYPTNWWVGMKWNKLQVMVHGDKIADNFPMIKMGPKGVKLATGVYLTGSIVLKILIIFFLILQLMQLQNLANLLFLF